MNINPTVPKNLVALAEDVIMNLEYAAQTQQGDRATNEDFFIHVLKKDWAMFAVADGLGGHEGGELASRYFCEGLVETIGAYVKTFQSSPTETMKKFMSAATKSMANKLKEKNFPDARTTCVIAWLDKKQTIIAHIGDSRVYFFNRAREIWRTRDHSLVQQFFEAGLLNENEMAHHPQQNIILRTIATEEKSEPDITILPALKQKELLLLCTDGFWEQISPTEMLDLISASNLKNSLEYLVKMAVQRAAPRSDNVTVIALRESQ